MQSTRPSVGFRASSNWRALYTSLIDALFISFSDHEGLGTNETMEQQTCGRWRSVADRLPGVVRERQEVLQILEELNAFVYPVDGLTAEVRGPM